MVNNILSNDNAKEKLVHVKGNTWYINATVTIPVYFLNNRDIIIVDSGYKDKDGEVLAAVIKENNLCVKAAIASHSHIDHIGNFAWLREEFGTELIMNDIEACIVYDVALISYLYRPIHTSVLEEAYKHIYLKPDRTFTKEDTEIDICGAKFKLIFAPGHTLGHTVIVTPDDVCYLGDAIVSRNVLEHSKLLTSSDWVADIETKQKLHKIKFDKYILAHSGVYEDIESLIDDNINRRLEIISNVENLLKTQSEWTITEIEKAVYKAFDMHTCNPQIMSIYRRNLTCLLEYLISKDFLSYKFEDGTFIYCVKA